MPPKSTPKPAAKRKAWNDAANARSLARRGAVKLLNCLAQELGVQPVPVKSRAARVEALVRLLERRCQSDGYPRRLSAAASQYVDNGGVFSAPLLVAAPATVAAAEEGSGDADSEAAQPLVKHRVLDEGFRLQSKAFMLTYNSRSFSTTTWPVFLKWVKERRWTLGARRWAACLEESLNSEQDPAGSGALAVYHLHAYVWWTDKVGIRRSNTDDLVFSGVRPRVDVCTSQAPRGRTLELAATQGLWYVAMVKAGTVRSSTNYVAWRDYTPKAEWYRRLWESHKLSNDMYEAYSRQLRAGHADRKRDLAELEADERRSAVLEHVAKEQARLAAVKALLPLRKLEEIDQFVGAFKEDMYRRAFLVIVGGTNLSKSFDMTFTRPDAS